MILLSVKDIDAIVQENRCNNAVLTLPQSRCLYQPIYSNHINNLVHNFLQNISQRNNEKLTVTKCNEVLSQVKPELLYFYKMFGFSIPHPDDISDKYFSSETRESEVYLSFYQVCVYMCIRVCVYDLLLAGNWVYAVFVL